MRFRDYIKEDYFEVVIDVKGEVKYLNISTDVARNLKQAKKEAVHMLNKDYGKGKYTIMDIRREKGNPGVTDKSPSEYERERKNKKSRYDRQDEQVNEGKVIDAIKEFVIVAHMSIRAIQMSGTKDSAKVKSKMVRLIDAANKIAPTFKDAKERADFFKKINVDIDKGVRGSELVKKMRQHLGDLSKEKATGKFMDDLDKQVADYERKNK